MCHFWSKFIINNELVLTVKAGDSFRYLGRHFDFSMSMAMQKPDLL